MKIYDVTAVFSEDLPTYTGDMPVQIQEHCEISKGAPCNVSDITFGSHAGTHVDVPKHFVDNGMTTENIPLDYFMGAAKVFDLTAQTAIDLSAIQDLDIKKGDIVLFKTTNSSHMKDKIFYKDYLYITEDAAKFLVEKQIKTVGVDYLSVEQFDSKDSKTHLTLLGNQIATIEGLVLTDVPAGEYEIIALPLKIKNGNGSPVRAILISR